MYHDSQGREIEDLEGENMRRDELEQQWKAEKLLALLEVETHSLGEALAYCLTSESYGDKVRYHAVIRKSYGVKIGKTKLQEDQIPQLLKILLTWYLQGEEQFEEMQAREKAMLDGLDPNTF